MKIVYPEWEQSIQLEENYVNCIYLERPEYFRQVIEELYHQVQGGEGRFILSNGAKVMEIKKQVEMIFSPFLLNIEDKKFYTEIYKQLQRFSVGEEMFAETKEIESMLQRYMLSLLDCMPYELGLGEELDFISFLKSMGIKIRSDIEALEDRLIEYMELVTVILKKNIFVLVNLKTYFSEQEIEKIYDSLLPKKIFLIDIERQKLGYHFPCERDIIIDADLCEL